MNPREHFWHQYFTDCCYPNLTLPFCELVSQRGLEVELVSILSPLAEMFNRPGDSREKRLLNQIQCSTQWARRALDENSLESKGRNLGFII